MAPSTPCLLDSLLCLQRRCAVRAPLCPLRSPGAQDCCLHFILRILSTTWIKVAAS